MTVETHVQHLMNKLGVGSRAEIAAWHAREVAEKPSG
jgi:DNA-binding CsgD family transcriptional regulator